MTPKIAKLTIGSLYMAKNPSKIQILFLSPRGKSYIEPKYLLKAINWIKHVQFLWGKKLGLSFAEIHSELPELCWYAMQEHIKVKGVNNSLVKYEAWMTFKINRYFWSDPPSFHLLFYYIPLLVKYIIMDFFWAFVRLCNCKMLLTYRTHQNNSAVHRIPSKHFQSAWKIGNTRIDYVLTVNSNDF